MVKQVKKANKQISAREKGDAGNSNDAAGIISPTRKSARKPSARKEEAPLPLRRLVELRHLDKMASWIIDAVDEAEEQFFPFYFTRADGTELVVEEEDSFRSMLLTVVDLPALKKVVRAKLRDISQAFKAGEGDEQRESSEADKAGEDNETVDGDQTDFNPSSDSDAASADADDDEEPSKKQKTYVEAAASAASAPAAVIITAARQAWPPGGELTLERLRTEQQFVLDSARSGIQRTCSDVLPSHTHDVIELTLIPSLGQAEAAKWLETYETRPSALIEKLIALLPSGGTVKKDFVAQLAAIRLKGNTPEDPTTATQHAHALTLVVRQHYGEKAKLKNIGAKVSTNVLKKFELQFRSSETDFLKTVGDLIFHSTEFGEIPTTVWNFCIKEAAVCTAIAKAINLVSKVYPKTVHLLKQGKTFDKNGESFKSKKRKFEVESTTTNQSTGKVAPCKGCGGKNCKPGNCRFWSHPHANRDKSKAWVDSRYADIYKNKIEGGKSFSYLPMNQQAVSADDGLYKLEPWSSDSSSASSKPDKKKKFDKQVSDIATTNILNFISGTSTFNPLISARNVDNGQHLGKGILDSGAFGGHINNYVSKAMVDSLIATNSIVSTCDCLTTKICTIVGCTQSSTCVDLKIELYNDLGQTITIDTKARLVQGLPYDFIIGLTTIRHYKLARVFDSLFEEFEGVSDLFSDDRDRINMDQQSATVTTKAVRPDVNESTNIAESAIKRPFVGPTVASREHEVNGGLFRQLAACSRPSATLMGGNPSNSVTCKCDTKHTLWCVACSTAGSQAVKDHGTYSGEVINLLECTTITDNKASAYSQRLVMQSLVRTILTRQSVNIISSKDEFLDIEDDTDNIDTFIGETPYDKLCSPKTISDSDPLRSITIEGTDEFLSKANLLVTQHANRFKTALTSEAARLKPFDLELQPGSTWYTSRQNKLPTRLQSRHKREATREFVTNALATGLIEPSQAESWSQILLTPKANGKWRFCVDYRFLNKETRSMGWPLPNIKQMLERIGEKKPKYFAVLDLTQGYYQMAISKKSRALTAFRTSEGLFQFRRLPMGLKSAPAFFQAAMQQTVLAEMLYQICEVYLDDIIVFAETEDELLANLSKIFSRLEDYNITLNPEKVKIGLRSVEYVGHVIDQDGLSFSRDKIKDILETPKPETHKQMKSFLGLCVQFKDHIDKYSDIVKPLHLMIPNYKKTTANQRLKWTAETEACFSELLDKVNTCPKLFFIDESAPVFLHTDASKYGIGGYLFQVVEGVQQPIAFISKTLSSTELRWSVPEKEGYAIFYCLMKLEHLLRDIHFVLKTDHKNLTFINTDFREKVKRWKLAIQHFDFDIEYIKGEDNIEADGFSRLCPQPTDPESVAFLNLLTERLPQNIYDKIHAVHNANAGHVGVDKTIHRLVKSGSKWKGMRSHVKHFVERCDLCQKQSAIKLDIQTMPFTLASYSPFERICVDTIGPLPTNDESKKYILVIIDAFSRFVMLRAIPDTTAKEAINGLLDWIGIFGIPSAVVSDNGTQFANELVDDLLELLATDNIKIHAYSKEENGIVERANKEVNRHVRSFVYERKDKKSWYKYLPLVQRILNASIHKSIGVSPAQITFGNAVQLDRQILPLPDEVSNPTSYKIHLQEMLQAQSEILKIAQKNQQETDDFQIAKRSRANKRKFGGQEVTEFPINSYVLVNYEGEEHKPPSKLHTHLRGPLRVVNYNGPIYTLQNLVHPTKLEDFHVKLLHPFKFDEGNVDPSEVAQHDEEYTGIKQVLEHKFTHKKQRKQDLQFKILWEGDKEPSWYPWNSTFGHAEKIHEYLIAHKLKKYIPTQYTWPRGYVPP